MLYVSFKQWKFTTSGLQVLNLNLDFRINVVKFLRNEKFYNIHMGITHMLRIKQCNTIQSKLNNAFSHEKKDCKTCSPSSNKILKLDGTVHFIWFYTFCAHVSFSYCAVFLSDSYSLDISIPFSSGMSVGVGYSVTWYLSLTANFALSWHLPHLLLVY